MQVYLIESVGDYADAYIVYVAAEDMIQAIRAHQKKYPNNIISSITLTDSMFLVAEKEATPSDALVFDSNDFGA